MAGGCLVFLDVVEVKLIDGYLQIQARAVLAVVDGWVEPARAHNSGSGFKVLGHLYEVVGATIPDGFFVALVVALVASNREADKLPSVGVLNFDFADVTGDCDSLHNAG